MMCRWYQRGLTAYADDELAGWRAVWLHRHLTGCAHCRADLGQLHRIRQWVAGQKPALLNQLDDTQFWPQLRQRLQTAGDAREIREVSLMGWFPGRRLVLVSIAASLLVTAMLAGWQTFAPDGGMRLTGDLPLLPPLGGGKVEFKDLKYAKNLWAGEVRFDKSDVDIPVIWVNGLTVAENEVESPSTGEGM